jgi:NAD(P)-dependent dehydrogenase (short-subunit alcohol dehydrogenase family)
VTGATDGLGRAMATRLAQLGATVVLHGRDADRIAETGREIRRLTGAGPCRLIPVRADLSSLAEVDALAAEVAGEVDALHLLINNAGVGFGAPDSPREESADGIELRFAVDHLAPWRLARRLLPLLRASVPSRVVQVASVGQAEIDLDDLLLERDWTGVEAYRRAKLAMVMATIELAEELRGSGVVVNALHPATLMETTMVTDSGIEPRSTLEEGVTAAMRIALDPTLDEVTGAFFDGTRQAPGSVHEQARDARVRAEVLRRSEELVDAALAQGAVPA